MNILLIKLNSEADEIIPPIGLGYLATAVRKRHKVTFLDCLKEKKEMPQVIDFIIAKKIDLVGLSFYTMNYPQIRRAAHTINKRVPTVKIVVGGPHPSALPKETLQEIPEIDFAFMGEAELGFSQLTDLLDSKKSFGQSDLQQIPSLVWRKNGNIVLNERKIVDDLDELGFPSWDLLKPDTYPPAPHGSFVKQFPAAPIIITRGCPYNCTFCAGHVVSGKKMRSRSLEHVMSEIRLLVKKFGVKEIHIEDDNFNFNRIFIEGFCKKLIEENLGITWACPNGVRLDRLDRELLLLMKKSGLYSVSVGVESGSDRIHKLVKKRLTTKIIREKVELINRIGLGTIGFVMLGFPTETRAEIEQTINFVCSLPLKRINFSFLQPFPGTEIYNTLIERGEIEKVNWSTCFLFKATYAPKGLTLKELERLRQKGLRKFYLRPKIVLSMLSEIKNPKQLYFVIRRGIRWLT